MERIEVKPLFVLSEALVDIGLAKTQREASRMIKSGNVYLNNVRIATPTTLVCLVGETTLTKGVESVIIYSK